MVTKKKQEVKQEEALQVKSKTKPEKKTATTKDAETEVKANPETKSQGKSSPSLAEQYKTLKEKHPDALLLFRKGDFYQALNEDARKTSDVLGITLTKPHDKSQGDSLAMFPHQSIDIYLPKLIRAGARVAIVDDMSMTKEQKVVTDVKLDGKKQEQPKEEVKAGAREQSGAEKTETARKEHREPQMVTVNGEKVSHAHVFQSNQNPDHWYFTAKLDGVQLRPMRMSAEDVSAYMKKESSVERLMQTYYPTKLEKKVTPEEFKADNKLSDGRVIDKMNVYKESNGQSADFGKYKLYAVVGDQKLSTLMSFKDLNAYFDRVTTPARLVEKNFGERLHLASAYEQYKLPEGVDAKVRVAKGKDGIWKISADLGEGKVTGKKPLSYDDGYSLFTAKTATREQLAAKYLSKDIASLLGQKQERSVSMKL